MDNSPVQKFEEGVSALFDVIGLDGKWVMTVTAPMDWDAHEVATVLRSRGYQFDNVLLRHASTREERARYSRRAR